MTLSFFSSLPIRPHRASSASARPHPLQTTSPKILAVHQPLHGLSSRLVTSPFKFIVPTPAISFINHSATNRKRKHQQCRDTISHFFGYLNLFSPLRFNNLEPTMSCFRHMPQRNMPQNSMSTPAKPAVGHYRNRLKPLRGLGCGDLRGGRLI